MTYNMPGTVYINSDTAAADTARRFTTGTLVLRDVLITVADYTQLLGDGTTQSFPLYPGSYWGPRNLDISDLYFKNQTAGENGTVYIIGTY